MNFYLIKLISYLIYHTSFLKIQPTSPSACSILIQSPLRPSTLKGTPLSTLSRISPDISGFERTLQFDFIEITVSVFPSRELWIQAVSPSKSFTSYQSFFLFITRKG